MAAIPACELLCFQVVRCRVCGKRADEWFYHLERTSPDDLCISCGGAPLPADWPRDRRGDPLEKRLVIARHLKRQRKRRD